MEPEKGNRRNIGRPERVFNEPEISIGGTVKPPTIPNKFRQCKRNLNTPVLHIPKLPVMKKNSNLLFTGLLNGIHGGTTKRNSLLQENISVIDEKKTIGAGRGGKYYSTGSHYSHF